MHIFRVVYVILKTVGRMANPLNQGSSFLLRFSYVVGLGNPSHGCDLVRRRRLVLSNNVLPILGKYKQAVVTRKSKQALYNAFCTL
jgi:hypothetical protein